MMTSGEGCSSISPVGSLMRAVVADPMGIASPGPQKGAEARRATHTEGRQFELRLHTAGHCGSIDHDRLFRFGASRCFSTHPPDWTAGAWEPEGRLALFAWGPMTAPAGGG